MKKFLLVLVVLIITLLIGSMIGKSYIEKQLASPVESEHIICIQKGLSTRGIVKLLNEANLMNPEWFYENYLKYIARSEKKFINAGCHHIPKGITKLDMINGLCSSKFVAQKQITFPEGLTYEEIAEIVDKKSNVSKSDFIKLCENKEFLKTRGVDAKNINGFLLPDTYKFDYDISAETIINRLLSAGKQLHSKENIAKANSMGMTMYEILILASIVEAETPVAEEYAKVAGVYHNRLRIGMALQADPTVQYALGNKKKLRREDMDINSPYNTYVYAGLPPTPINNPGKGAIIATLNPAKHDYLYFVAIGDGSGRHNFSVDFKGHQKNIAKYKKNRIKNKL